MNEVELARTTWAKTLADTESRYVAAIVTLGTLQTELDCSRADAWEILNRALKGERDVEDQSQALRKGES